MSLRLRNSALAILPFLVLLGCTPERTFEDSFYQKTASEWKAYLAEIEMVKESLSNRILIIANTTACQPCLNEIAQWDLLNDEMETKVSLIVIEKHKINYDSFFAKMNIKLPSFQDSTSMIFENDLIPYPPVKVYFDETETVQMIYPVGAEGKKEQFMNRMGS